jgi:hypothetical protein
MALTVLCAWTVPLLFVDALYSGDPAKQEMDLLIWSFILTSISIRAK